MLPVVKVVIVVVKLVIKPFVTNMRKIVHSPKHQLIERIIYKLGKNVINFRYYINQKFKNPGLPVKKKKEISHEAALIAGTEFFFEWICVYFTLFCIGMYEIKKSVHSSIQIKNKIDTLEIYMKKQGEINTKLEANNLQLREMVDNLLTKQKEESAKKLLPVKDVGI